MIISETTGSNISEAEVVIRITESGARGPAGIGAAASLTETASLADADQVPVAISASGSIYQIISWANIKALLTAG